VQAEPPPDAGVPPLAAARASTASTPTVALACEPVLAAFRAKDDEAGDALAARERPDRGLVAEALAERGAAAAGAWWVSGALGTTVEMLPADSDRRIALGLDAEAAAWRDELRRIGAEQDVAALEALAERLDGGLTTVRRVEVAIEAGHAGAGAEACAMARRAPSATVRRRRRRRRGCARGTRTVACATCSATSRARSTPTGSRPRSRTPARRWCGSRTSGSNGPSGS